MNIFKRKAQPAPMPAVVGKKLVFGIPEKVMPVRGVDAKAQAKIVFRHNQTAELVMLTDQQDSAFQLEDRGDYWIVDAEIRREVIVK